MTKISISVAAPLDSLEAYAFLHRRLDMALSSAKRRLAMGQTGLFYTTELFLNDHEEKDGDIRDILDWFSARDIELFIVIIPYDMEWAEVSDMAQYRDTPEYLINMLNAAREEQEYD